MADIITPAQAFDLVQAKQATYLDVRSFEEFEAGHAVSAKHIPFSFRTPDGPVPNPNFVAEVKQAFPNLDEALFVACNAGGRAAKAFAALKEAGYTNVKNYAGGWKGWSEAGYPVEK